MYVYDGKIVQTDNTELMSELKKHGVGVIVTNMYDENVISVGEEFALQYRAEPKKLMLVRLVSSQYNFDGTYYKVIMRLGAFYSPDELKGGVEKFPAGQSISEIDV